MTDTATRVDNFMQRLQPVFRWMRMGAKYAALAGLCAFLGAIAPGLMMLGTALIVIVGVGDTCHSLFKLRSPKAVMESVLVFFILTPIALAALLTPVHAVYYFFLEHIPKAWMEHFFQNPWEADLTLPRMDLTSSLAAALALPAIALVILRERYWLGQHCRQIENLATSKVSSAALGVVELVGVYQPGPEPEPAFEWGASRLKKPFYLEDATGRVLVDPSGTQGLNGLMTSMFHLELAEVSIERESLKPGDPLFVVGTLEINKRAPTGAAGTAALVVRRPGKSGEPTFKKLQEFRQEVLGGGAKGRSLQDTFFIADGDEATARKRLREMQRKILWRGAVMLAACLWLLISRLDRLYPRLTLPDDPGLYTEDPAVHRLLTYAYHPTEGYRQWARVAILQEEPAIPPSMQGALALDLFLNTPYTDSRSWASWKLCPDDGRDSNPCEIDRSYSRFTTQMAAVLRRSDTDRDSRRVLLRLLGRIREPRESVVMAMLDRLRNDTEPSVRQAAVGHLVGFTPERGQVTPALAAALTGTDPDARAQAEAELERLAPGSWQLLPALAQAMLDADYYTRSYACKGVVRYGAAALPTLLQVYETGSADTQAEAVWGAQEINPGPEWLVPFLRRALQGKEHAPRQAALGGVEDLKAAGQPLHADVVALLHHADPKAVQGAIPTLAKLEPPPALVATDWAVIRQGLRAPNDYTRQAAIQLLKGSPFPREEIVQELLTLAQSPAQPEIHGDMLMGLTQFPAEAGVAVPYLIACLANPQQRGLAATVLGKIGSVGLAATPQLVAMLEDAQSWDRDEAAEALRGIGAFETLGQLLQHEDGTVRSFAFEALKKSGPAAVAAMPALVKQLEHPSDNYSVQNALQTLLAIGPAAREALPAIHALLERGPQERRPWFEAGEAIVRLTTPVEPADWAVKRLTSPILAFRFEDSLAEDRSPIQLETLTGSVKYGDGLQGRSAELDGDTRLQREQAVDLSQGYTLEIAFRYSGKSAYYGGEPTVLDCDLMRIYNEGTWRYTVWLPNTQNLGSYVSCPLAGAPQWQHTAVVWNPYRHEIQVYANGKKIHDRRDYGLGTEVVEGVYKLNITLPQHQLRNLMLSSRRDQKHVWNGSIDDLKLYDYPRSPEQIAAAAAAFAEPAKK